MTEPRSLAAIREVSVQHMPQVEPQIVPGSYRWNVIDGLEGKDNFGIELGVAAGSFSKRMMESGKFRRFWGVDSYSDGHDTAQYKQALKRVGLRKNYHLLRMTFDEAVDLFPDAFFDFIYVDGYAHSGEEGGRTMLNWYAKLKPGGILAGDDYDPWRWPLVVWGVNHLAKQLGVPLFVTAEVLSEAYNNYPSWFMTKPLTPPATPLAPDPLLVRIGQEERDAVAKQRAAQRKRPAAKPAGGSGPENG